MAAAKNKTMTLTPGYVAYVRVSDPDVQSPERSHGYQIRLIKNNLIEPSGLPLLEIYADSDSGRNNNRVNYQRMLSDARAGKFSHVAIAFVDRFSRDNLEGNRAFEELLNLGIKVRIAMCVSAEYEKPDGAFVISLLLGVARLESARTGQRTRQGMLEKLNGGGWGWSAPDGYRNTEIRKSLLEPSERAKHAFHKHDIEIDPERIEVVRVAFELLLRDDGQTLAQIAEELHARGYKRSKHGTTWVSTINGKRYAYAKQLSRLYHNWFYAGWVVVDNEWAKIPPKTIRGNWTPLLSTEDFERGLQILAERNENKQQTPKHFYLLQRLLYLEQPSGKFIRFTCQLPNAGRAAGGTAYYSVRNSASRLNFICEDVDAQVAAFLWDIQVNEDSLSVIREAYRAEVSAQLGTVNAQEQARLKKALDKIRESEKRAARLFMDEKISYETYDQLANEVREERAVIQATLDGMSRSKEVHIASLDDALQLISKTGVLFEKLEPIKQRELLLHLVKRIVISAEGEIVRIELRPPFCYLHELITGQGKLTAQKAIDNEKAGCQRVNPASSSVVSLCAPKYNQNERTFRFNEENPLQFAELTAYPQRSALEPLLAID